MGAIVALCLLFLGRIVYFARTQLFPEGENGDRTWINHLFSLTAFIAFAGHFSSHHAAATQSGAKSIWAALNGDGPGAGDWRHRNVDYRCLVRTAARCLSTTHVEQMTLLQAIWIGLCQTLSAVFPGTSRSMSTIAEVRDECGPPRGLRLSNSASCFPSPP